MTGDLAVWAILVCAILLLIFQGMACVQIGGIGEMIGRLRQTMMDDREAVQAMNERFLKAMDKKTSRRMAALAARVTRTGKATKEEYMSLAACVLAQSEPAKPKAERPKPKRPAPSKPIPNP